MTGIDGVNHINVYSKGRTSIGRWLSNFTFAPFEHPKYGRFASMEGFWYWRLANSDERREKLRNLHGWAAKKYGRELVRCEDPDSLEFQLDIAEGLRAKLDAYPERKREFKATVLPLTHYYEYGGTRVVGGAQWVIEILEWLRSEI